MIVLFVPQPCSTADLAIQIPGNLNQDGIYRLDYNPPHGVPSPNTTIASRDIGDVIEFSQGLPGTKYEFRLYYSNNTRHDWLTWTASITTGEFVVACGL
jgi:cadherin 5 type 2 (VE-cadherin)